MKAATADSLEHVLQPTAAELGLDVEDLAMSNAGRRRLLRIAVDKDGGVTLDDVADATRAFSRALDDAGVMGEQTYILEVTSPGLDRPLTSPRHWRRNLGRLVKVTSTEGVTTLGRVIDCDESHANLDVDGVRRTLAYADVARARVQVEFNRKED